MAEPVIGGLQPYPLSLPDDVIERIITIIGGGSVDLEDAHRAWHIAGYVLSKIDAHAPKTAVPSMTKEQMIETLRGLKSDGTMKAIDWAKLKPILVFALQLLMQWAS